MLPSLNVARRNCADGLNVVLTGTSNSLFVNGFSTGLAKHSGVKSFRNKSLGASGTAAIAYHAHDLDLTDTDFLFIEYSVNENMMLDNGKELLANTFTQIANIVDKASQAGCVPILVHFPTSRDLQKKTQMQKLAEEEFARRGLASFNVADIIQRAASIAQVDPASYFHDPLHLHRTVAFAMGRALLDTVETWRHESDVASCSIVSSPAYKQAAYMPITSGTQSDLIDRANSLTSSQLLRIANGGNVTVNPGEDSLIIRGCIYNASRSRGSLYFSDGYEILTTNDPAVYGGPRDLVLVGLPAQPHETHRSSETLIRFEAPEEDREAVFELAGFVVEYPTKERALHVGTLGEDYVALHERVSEADIDRISKSLPPSA